MHLEAVKKVKRSRPFTALDAMILAVLIAAIAVSAVLIYRRPAQTVTITAPGYERTLPLDRDATVQVNGVTVRIAGGEVWVTDADCPDKLCVKTGKISDAGRSIVCLPNGVTVSVGGSGELQWEVGR